MRFSDLQTHATNATKGGSTTQIKPPKVESIKKIETITKDIPIANRRRYAPLPRIDWFRIYDVLVMSIYEKRTIRVYTVIVRF